MKRNFIFTMCLVMGLNVFAQNQVFKAMPSAEVKNFKVAETQHKQRFSAKSSVRNYVNHYVESEAFYTTYDIQSNSYLGNRMYQLNDGSVGVVATMSLDEQGNFNDRGTGYNFYKEGNIYASNDIPQVREEANATGEDVRTGWPSIAPYGTEGEILVNHNGNSLLYYTRAKAGEGVWNGPYAIPNPDGLALSWPRIVTTGTNNNTVHIFAADEDINSSIHQYYLRSADLQNWDIQYSPLEQDNLHIGYYAADDYVVSANGNNIAVVYNNWEKAHTILYKSTNNGLTWESRIIWENPIYGLDWETDEASLFDELYAPAQVSVAMGADGVAHVALSVGLYSRSELGAGYTLHWGLKTDGIAYWNSTYETPLRSPQDDDLRNALRLWWTDPEWEGNMFLDFTNFCAMTPPHTEEGFNYFDSQKQYHGSEGSAGDYLLSFGLSAYPAIAVDPAGNLAIAYSAPDVNRDELYYDEYGNPYYYRSIFVNYKPANVDTWSEVENISTPTNLYSASVHSQSECTFVSAVSNPKNVNEFWFSCMTDDTPGFHTGVLGASQDHITTGTINVFKFNPTGDINDEPLPEEKNYWTPDPSLYANNMTVITTIEIDGVAQSDLNLEIGAFCGDEVRGSGRLQYVGSPMDKYECFLMLYGNSDDNITFKLYDHATETELDLKTNESVTFEVNGTVGDVMAPHVVNFTSRVAIDVVANPEEGGTVSGSGNYHIGDTAVLTVTANEKYAFINWTVNDEVVGDDNNYMFIVEESMSFVANLVMMLPPQNLKAESTSVSEISLTWDAVENALSYNVYQSNELIANVSETSFTVENLEYYTDYCFTVSSVRNETESEKSEESCAKTYDLPVTTPSNLKAESTSISEINLTWDAVENALSYNVYQSNKLIANVSETSFTVENLEYYTDYCFTVSSVRNESESDKSAESCAKTYDLPVTTPSNLKAESTSVSEINLTWDAVENALSYNVYQSNELIANVSETSFTVENLEYYTDYCFTVSSVRNESESDKSEESCAKTYDLPVTAPANLKAESTSISEIDLTWDAVENALSYNVYQSNELIANVSETSFTVENLEYYTDYCFSVTAVRNETESDKSEEACAKTFDLPVTAPANLKAESASISEIDLTWDAVENALIYKVYRNGEYVAEVSNTTYTDKDLEYNTEYCYTVSSARNETESEKSEEVCAKTLGEAIEELASSINIYPNPVEDELFVVTEMNVEEVAIYDLYGRQAMSQQVNESTSQQVVDVADLEAGVYFVNIKTENGNIVKRFVKK